MGNNDERARENACGPDASNGTAYDKRQTAVGHAADETAQLEQANGEEVRPFDVEKGVKLSEK
jgi:hypothetical protein